MVHTGGMPDGPRELTPLGQLILRRMAELGMSQQQDLATRAGIANSTISRLLYVEQRRAHIPTLRRLAEALDIDPDGLTAFVYGDAANVHTDAALPPLAVEIGRMLAPDSPLPTEERDLLAALLDRVVAPSRPLMRRKS